MDDRTWVVIPIHEAGVVRGHQVVDAHGRRIYARHSGTAIGGFTFAPSFS